MATDKTASAYCRLPVEIIARLDRLAVLAGSSQGAVLRELVEGEFARRDKLRDRQMKRERKASHTPLPHSNDPVRGAALARQQANYKFNPKGSGKGSAYIRVADMTPTQKWRHELKLAAKARARAYSNSAAAKRERAAAITDYKP